MNPSKTDITLERLKGVRYIVSVIIPTVYTNELSYYEVASKLIKHLDEIKTNQDDNSNNMTTLANFIYEAIGEQINYLNEIHTNFNIDINRFLSDSETKWNNFITQELNKYNTYLTTLKNNLNTYQNNLTTKMNSYKTTLTNVHNTFNTNLDNMHNTHLSNLENIISNYRLTINSDETRLTNYLTQEFEKIITNYGNLVKKINASKISMQTLINNKERNWELLVDELEDKYMNITDQVLAKNNTLEQIINYLKTVPQELLTVGEPLYTWINYTGINTPTNPTEGEIWLKTENIGDEVDVTNITRLYKYTNNEWQFINDNKLYMTRDFHLYICDSIVLPFFSEELSTPTGEGFNTSAWYVPVGYDKKETENLISLQQYDTETENKIQLDYKHHSYFTCNANRGYGAYNLKYKNINNDFQRILTLKDNSVCLQNDLGIFKGNQDFPNPYTNNCNPDVSTPITNEAKYTLVTGIFRTDYPILFNTETNVYFAYYNEKFIPLGSAEPRFTIGTIVYSFRENDKSEEHVSNQSYYINLTNPDIMTSLVTPKHNEMAEEWQSLQLSEDEKYIYSNRKVWKTEDFLAVIENPLLDLKPILVLPEACEHAHIYNDTLYTTHTNYVINLLNPLPDKFRSINIDIRANGIWSEDESTWKNGYVYNGMFWQFALINETDKTVPHRTTYGLQGVLMGAREIEYVPVQSTTN